MLHQTYHFESFQALSLARRTGFACNSISQEANFSLIDIARIKFSPTVSHQADSWSQYQCEKLEAILYWAYYLKANLGEGPRYHPSWPCQNYRAVGLARTASLVSACRTMAPSFYDKCSSPYKTFSPAQRSSVEALASVSSRAKLLLQRRLVDGELEEA